MTSEKERVYAELASTQAKLVRLKREVRNLRNALSEPALRKVRSEHAAMKKALSYIGHSPSAPEDAEALKVVARAALLEPAHTKRGRAKRLANAKREASGWRPL